MSYKIGCRKRIMIILHYFQRGVALRCVLPRTESNREHTFQK